MNFEKSYNMLDEISEKESINTSDLKLLLELSNSENEEIRSYVAELLVLSSNPCAKDVLIKLCNDPDELVRVNACDSLSVFNDYIVYDALYNRVVGDDSDLVKRFALLSIIDIMSYINVDKQTLGQFFTSTLKKERSVGIQVACYKGLYLLGDKAYLQNLINYIYQDNYQDRCFAVNELYDILNIDNLYMIKKALIDLKKKEKTEAVLSTIENILDKINQM